MTLTTPINTGSINTVTVVEVPEQGASTKQALCISIGTIFLSIPALIGA